MKRRLWLVPLVFGLSCSSHDQSLGESHPSPHPIIDPKPDPKPNPNPNPNPDPDPDPNPNPNPDPDPNPTPTTPPCQDYTLHVRTGECVSPGTCKGHVLSVAGYECTGTLVCCDAAPGCSQFDCGSGGSGGSGGSVISQSGEGGDAGAGAGGKP